MIIPVSAAYDWDNSININKDNMTWSYTEKYSGDRSVIFKKYIDVEFGNNDGFVGAWELLKTDVSMSEYFKQSIEDNMDVMIDNSSKNITLLGVETEMSFDLIGPTDKESDIVNKYEVFYEFANPLDESGSLMWFQGEPQTDIKIVLPAGMELLSVGGINHESVKKTSEGTTIDGTFGFTGEVTIEYSIDEEPPVSEVNTTSNATKESSDPVKNTRVEDFFDRLFSADINKLIKKLNPDNSNLS